MSSFRFSTITEFVYVDETIIHDLGIRNFMCCLSCVVDHQVMLLALNMYCLNFLGPAFKRKKVLFEILGAS
jgi:hypothetical protein